MPRRRQQAILRPSLHKAGPECEVEDDSDVRSCRSKNWTGLLDEPDDAAATCNRAFYDPRGGRQVLQADVRAAPEQPCCLPLESRLAGSWAKRSRRSGIEMVGRSEFEGKRGPE